LKCDGTRAETRFRLSPKRTSPFKSVGASVQSTAGSRGVRINGSNAGYTMFRGSVKSTGYPLLSPVSPSIPLPCVTVCHQVSNALYIRVLHHDSCTRFLLPDLCKIRYFVCIAFVEISPKNFGLYRTLPHFINRTNLPLNDLRFYIILIILIFYNFSKRNIKAR
jgi:hypothetical protein